MFLTSKKVKIYSNLSTGRTIISQFYLNTYKYTTKEQEKKVTIISKTAVILTTWAKFKFYMPGINKAKKLIIIAYKKKS